MHQIEPIRRRVDGTIDFDFYRTRATAMRSRARHDVVWRIIQRLLPPRAIATHCARSIDRAAPSRPTLEKARIAHV